MCKKLTSSPRNFIVVFANIRRLRVKGSAKVIKILNDVLMAELTAINQYVLHASMCKNWGLKTIGQKVYEESIDEMKHAQSLIDRILFLDGYPNVQNLFPLNIGKSVLEQLKSDLELEEKAIKRLQEAIPICRAEKDVTSALLLEDILKSEEEHVDWIEDQLEVINQVGIENYLAQQI